MTLLDHSTRTTSEWAARGLLAWEGAPAGGQRDRGEPQFTETATIACTLFHLVWGRGGGRNCNSLLETAILWAGRWLVGRGTCCARMRP